MASSERQYKIGDRLSVWVIGTRPYTWHSDTTDIKLKSDPDGDDSYLIVVSGDVDPPITDQPIVIELVALPTDTTVNRWRIVDG